MLLQLKDNLSGIWKLWGSALSPVTDIGDEISAPEIKRHLKPEIIAKLSNRARDFAQKADRALMLLWTEIRLRCADFILDVLHQNQYNLGVNGAETEVLIVQLTKELRMVDEVLSSILGPAKMEFLYLQLPNFIARLMMRGKSISITYV